MGQVRVVDRASKEIVVFLAGDIDSGMEEQLNWALSEVTMLERLDDLHRVVVDAREVTSLGPAGSCATSNVRAPSRDMTWRSPC
jgi:hypothetical protein